MGEFEPRYGQRVCVLLQDTKSQLALLTRKYQDLSVVGNITILVDMGNALISCKPA